MAGALPDTRRYTRGALSRVRAELILQSPRTEGHGQSDCFAKWPVCCGELRSRNSYHGNDDKKAEV
eukprot:5156707-Pleurochrysis_carterae.AAC.4